MDLSLLLKLSLIHSLIVVYYYWRLFFCYLEIKGQIRVSHSDRFSYNQICLQFDYKCIKRIMTVADNNWKNESLSPSRTTGGETERPDLVSCNPEAVTWSSQAGRRCRFNKIGFMRKMKLKVCLQRMTAAQIAVTTHSGDGSQEDSINLPLNPFFLFKWRKETDIFLQNPFLCTFTFFVDASVCSLIWKRIGRL